MFSGEDICFAGCWVLSYILVLRAQQIMSKWFIMHWGTKEGMRVVQSSTLAAHPHNVAKRAQLSLARYEFNYHLSRFMLKDKAWSGRMKASVWRSPCQQYIIAQRTAQRTSFVEF